MDFKTIKKDFPWFKENKSWIYLDSGASSLKPKCVIDRVTSFYSKYCFNTHNNDSPLTTNLNQIIKNYRASIAKYINAKANEIVFTSGATESMNLIINNIQHKLKKNDEVILTHGEHTTNLIPWIQIKKTNGIKIAYAGREQRFPTINDFVKLISKNTKVISFTAVSNLFGYEIDMEKMVKSVKAVNKNIIIIVDATQAIPTQKIDVVKFDVDFLICSAHKMCGPTGIGLLYGKFKLLDKFISPLRLGGGMNGDVSETDYSLVSLPDRLEGGTLHGAGIFGFYEATQYLQKVGIDKITKYLADLKKYIDQQFKTIPNIQYFQTNSKHPICAFNIKGINPQDLANYLGKNKIIVRAGMSCVKLQNYITNTPAGAVRASFYFYNTKADVDALVNTLKKFKKTIILKNLI